MDTERLIAKYFLNQLTKEEKIQFDSLMQSDAAFKGQVEFESKVRKSVYQDEHSNLKQKLKDIEQNLEPKQNKTKWYLAAASVVILLCVGFLWNLSSSSSERLFENYYQTASNTIHPIVRDNNVKDQLTKAFIAYENKDYDIALVQFENLYNTSTQSELLFYQGICYLEMNKPNLAIESFLRHKNLNDDLSGKTNWYLALAYLKAEEKDKTKMFLEEIMKNKSNYNYEKAKSLLSEL